MPASAAVITFPAPALRPAEVPPPCHSVHYIGTAAARVDLARADLRRAQQPDVATSAPSTLVTLVEALRGSLTDILQMTCAPHAEWEVLERAEAADLGSLGAESLKCLVGELAEALSGKV